jgi:dTDP-4-amino-4,6-dideoxygalactose transaminase
MSAHPDAQLLARTRAALDRWEEAGGGPTSSITGGGAIAAFETSFRAWLRRRHALALPSGSAALRVGLAACGVSRGDDVICPAYDWPAAASAARSLGAHVRYADIDATTFTMAPESLAATLTSRTRAVVVTHLFGVVADVAALRTVTDAKGVPLIEDCAQALGARVSRMPVGSGATMAAFSFGPGKRLDAFEGGMLVTDDTDLHCAAVAASQHPVRQLLAGIAEPRKHGLPLRVHPLAAIVAWAELDDALGRVVYQRRQAARIYARLAQVPGARRPAESQARNSWQHVPAAIPLASRAALQRVGLTGASDLGGV